MRASVGVFVIGLCLTACSKKAPEPDSQAQPGKSAQPPSTNAPEDEVNPHKTIYPIRTRPPASAGSAGVAPQR